MTRFHVTIDRLVLQGLDPAARRAFVAGLEAELSRTLVEPAGRAARSSRTPVLRLDRVAVEPGGAGARALGVQVANGIGRKVKP